MRLQNVGRIELCCSGCSQMFDLSYHESRMVKSVNLIGFYWGLWSNHACIMHRRWRNVLHVYGNVDAQTDCDT